MNKIKIFSGVAASIISPIILASLGKNNPNFEKMYYKQLELHDIFL
tara:strand:+ start:519 stop:656 length:138 start_codon:yes stop_codon:yes gene_type:complete